MGGKQVKPMLDVHTVKQRLSRSEQSYLQNLFVYLCTLANSNTSNSARSHATSSTSTPTPTSSGARLGGVLVSNQSSASSLLANPSPADLYALRLPKSFVIQFFLLPTFPTLTSTLADRFFHAFEWQAYGSGMDLNELLVMVWTLWYGHSHEELLHFMFTLYEAGGYGGGGGGGGGGGMSSMVGGGGSHPKVAKKEFRKAVTALLEEQRYGVATIPIETENDENANNQHRQSTSTAVPGTSGGKVSGKQSSKASSSSSSSTSVVAESHREWLSNMIDFYYYLACYQYDRDRDKCLNAHEFALFADEDAIVSSFLARQQPTRVRKQQLEEMLRLPVATFETKNGFAMAMAMLQAGAAYVPPPLSFPSSPSLTSQGLTFTGEMELEESAASVWRRKYGQHDAIQNPTHDTDRHMNEQSEEKQQVRQSQPDRDDAAPSRTEAQR